MIRILSAIFAVLVSFVASAGLRESFATPPPGYGEVPFWWWGGEKLDKGRIREQLRELHAKGVSGTQINYSHLRLMGWPTAPHEPEIFSDAWWDIFVDAVVASDELGMGIGVSGYTIDWPGNDNLFGKLGISAPETRGRVLEARADPSAPYGLSVKPVVRDNTLDPLNPESARRVIARWFEPFLAHVPEEHHKALNYFFQDELRLSGDKHVWRDDFPEEFEKRKGYDVVPKLAALFKDIGPETYKIRIDYNDVMVALTEERYFKPIYDWHASRGMIYACDPALRGYDPCEFGDYMRAMKWYTAPGFDTPGTSADVVKNKVGSSISHLYGRPRVWLEGYHSQGWQASTATIFDSTVHNYVYGANLFNLHGFYYSTYGGWWEWAPPCYHFHQPYWACMDATLKYFERLSYLLTRGDHVCDIAVVMPQETVVADEARAQKGVKIFHELIRKLVCTRTRDLDVLNAEKIAEAEVKDGCLRVAGESYRVVVLPDMFVLRDTTRAKLDAFEKTGGTVIRQNEMPTDADLDRMAAAVATPDVVGPAGIKTLHRRTPEFDFYYLVDLDAPAEVSFRATGTPERWDPWTGKTEPLAAVRVADGITTLALEGRKGMPHVIAFDRTKTARVAPAAKKTLAPRVKVLDGLWDFSLVPTLDNTWGDYRRPAEKGAMIGAELRFLKNSDTGEEVAAEYGPQWFETTDGKTNLVSYSRRYGVFGKPVFQNCHHGLRKEVGNAFFILGDWNDNVSDVIVPEGAKPARRSFFTYVYADRAKRARVHAEGVAPAPVWEPWSGIDQRNPSPAPAPVVLRVGGRDVQAGDIVALEKGYTPVEAAYEAFGRAIVYLSDADLWPGTPGELASRLSCYDVFPTDPYAGARDVARYEVTVPAGTDRIRLELNGSVSDAKIDGEWTYLGFPWKYCDILPRTRDRGTQPHTVVFTVSASAGYGGGNVFRSPPIVEISKGAMALGDWARLDALKCYSGGACYAKRVVLTAAEAESKRALLDLGGVGAAARVRVNAGEERVLVTPPWETDVSGRLVAGTNTVEVTVYNTLNNHYQSIPTRYKTSTDAAPSGLLGPVRLVFGEE